MAKYCTNCGVENEDTAKYCKNCAASLENAITDKNDYLEGKGITEIRFTCMSCGEIWHAKKSELLMNNFNKVDAANRELGKGICCMTGCWPAIFFPKAKVKDYNKCPKCNSKNVEKKEIKFQDCDSNTDSFSAYLIEKWKKGRS